ncbi:DUF4347 domain-containing protein [Piscinibacter sakaiensis]|uniref:DUF4347 domain-containing protein n=1 Tax=Piscinibacter sakaiensis TaxID=1547922 RepID=UPI003AAD105B
MTASSPRRQPARPRLLVEELEPRILFSADASALLAAAGIADAAQVRLFEQPDAAIGGVQAAPAAVQWASRQEIIFIDSRVPDAFGLADTLMRQRGDGRMFDIAILDANEDGAAQISRVLASERNLAAIHIISHGSDGVLELGNSRLDNQRLTTDADAIAWWGQSLATGGDLLLYGCDVAQGETGQAFVQNLARLTGADVAASSDLTGQAMFGGNWSFEFHTGSIETGSAVGSAAQADWVGTLSITTNSISSAKTIDAGATSLTWSHTVNAGADRMMVVALSLILGQSTSVNYGGTPMTLIGRYTGMHSHTVEFWRLLTPAVGSANVVANFDMSRTVIGGAATFNGIDQTTPTGTVVGASADSTTASVTVASAPGDLVIDALFVDMETGVTAAAGQTEHWELYNGRTGSGSTKAGAASVTMTWTLAGADEWNIAAVALKPVSNLAPTLTNGAIVALAATDEDTSSAPTTVDAILTGAGWADGNAGAARGIAVTAVNGRGGWQYSTDGAAWTSFGAVSATNALLLNASSRVRYQPDGLDGESASFAFRAWDQTTGSASANAAPSYANPGAGGGSSAYSSQSASASSNVTSVNDAPTLSDVNVVLAPTVEDAGAPAGAVGTLVSALIDSGGPLNNVADPDTGALLGIAVIGADNANGSWHYSINNGLSWNLLGAVAANNARLLASDARLYFQPNADYSGTLAAALTFRAWDRSSGSNGGTASTMANGGSSAFSAATDTASLVVSAVNDAPVLDNTGTMALPNGLQDAANPSGITVTALIASAGGDRITDVDAGAIEGIAITAASSAIGSWQFSTDGGAIWTAVGSVSDSQARLLGATPSDMVRFVSNPGASGSATFSFRAWDRSDGRASGAANIDASSNGGSTPFSAATQLASVYVEPLQVILWLSTSGDVTASGVSGMANWSQSNVLAVGDPGLSFGSNSTGGRVTSVTDFDNFGSDVDIVGLHRVGRAVTLSGAGISGGSVSLLAGDMLFVTEATENLSTTAGSPPAGWSSSITTSAGSIYAYRPAAANDYGSGFFRRVTTGSLGANTTREIALVETATTVGGTPLAAGDLLFTQSGNLQQNSIYWYRTASNNDVRLVDGSQVGIPGGGGAAPRSTAWTWSTAASPPVASVSRLAICWSASTNRSTASAAARARWLRCRRTSCGCASPRPPSAPAPRWPPRRWCSTATAMPSSTPRPRTSMRSRW